MRRLVVLLVVLALAGLTVLPSEAAAKPKKKPDYKGTWTYTLYPDPSEDVLNLRGDGCQGVSPKGKESRSFTVPAAGKLTVALKSPDPTGRGVTDWDLWLIDKDDVTIAASHGPTSDELATAPFKKKTTFNIVVCNVTGSTDATLTWVFKYS